MGKLYFLALLHCLLIKFSNSYYIIQIVNFMKIFSYETVEYCHKSIQISRYLTSIEWLISTLNEYLTVDTLYDKIIIFQLFQCKLVTLKIEDKYFF